MRAEGSARRGRLGTLLGVSALAFTGCPTHRSFHEPPGEQCPPSSATDLCYRCGDENCCKEYAAYKADPNGSQYKDCLSACTEDYDTCVIDCDSQNHAGHVAFAPYLACSTFSCADECSPPQDACRACVTDNCAESDRKCTEQADCDTLAACTDLCPPSSTDCVNQCKQMATGATVELFDAFWACGKQYCATACE